SAGHGPLIDPPPSQLRISSRARSRFTQYAKGAAGAKPLSKRTTPSSGASGLRAAFLRICRALPTVERCGSAGVHAVLHDLAELGISASNEALAALAVHLALHGFVVGIDTFARRRRGRRG